ncbi:MAG: CcmD family protein [Candidatus Kapabacteria bacterium]|jgi:CcmD family protein|nr:CcmD family protein [Candidatus Kapabacteria bacterium]
MMEFLENNTLYIVLIISLIIWIGIAYYLWRIDNRLKKSEAMLSVRNEKKN